MERERRRALRFRLIAPAELIDETSGARSTAYVTDFNLYGCTLGVRHPPRKGTPIRIEVVTAAESFESRATVAHSHGRCAGLTFRDVKPQSLTILQRWLVTARQKQQERPQTG
jgi:hypothetical protein